MGGFAGGVWSCAMGICEPRQVRKEAAINGYFHVPQISLTLPAKPLNSWLFK